jgi:hypothetical protein
VIWTKRTILLVIAMLSSAACSAAAPLGDEAAKQEVISDVGKRAASPLAGEAAEQEPIIDAVKTAIDRHDYNALNRMETEFRKTRSRTGSGIWRLSVFHWRVLTELGPKKGDCQDRSADFFKGWIAATPDQPAPYITRAAVLEDYAWCLRGDGFASSVSALVFGRFAAKVDEASKILADHHRIASIDPHYYAVMERIYIDQGAAKADFKRLLDEGTAQEPDYHYLYFDAYRYYQPQWYGSDAEIDELARYAAARTARTEGLGMYARFYWFATDCKCSIRNSIDWSTMKAAMRDVMDRYPSDWNAANFARISCDMRDYKEAGNWLNRVKKDYSDAWNDEVEMRRCESMAQVQKSTIHSAERCPYAAIEAWPNADFEKYCRHPT